MSSTADLNLKEVIRKSTSEVSLDDLAKKGFTNVKVINRETVQRLIAEAVDGVVSERLKDATQKDREQITAAARERFNKLLEDQRRAEGARQESEIARRDAEIARLLAEIQRIEADSTRMRAELQVYEAKPAQPQAAAPASGELKTIQEMLEKLSRKISAGGGQGGGVEIGEGREAELAIKSMLAAISETPVESNADQINVKSAKATGVNKTLEKLRNLQKGSGT